MCGSIYLCRGVTIESFPCVVRLVLFVAQGISRVAARGAESLVADRQKGDGEGEVTTKTVEVTLGEIRTELSQMREGIARLEALMRTRTPAPR